MTRTEHLLAIIAEECAEVAQRCTKALRFGLTETEPGQSLTNAERIVAEMNDLMAVYQLLAAPPAPTCPLFGGKMSEWLKEIEAKKVKVEKFLAYSKTLGTLDG